MTIDFFFIQPIGIDQIAAKKGKVYGDTHDGHRFTQTQSEGMEQTVSRCQLTDQSEGNQSDSLQKVTANVSQLFMMTIFF